MKIVIIDDNVDFANALRRLLEVSGYREVGVAYRGSEGIELAKSTQPDFVLIDLGMPEMDGFAVAAAIQRELAGMMTTFVAITGYGQDSDRRNTRKAKFDFHLTKPFSIVDLKQILGKPDRILHPVHA